MGFQHRTIENGRMRRKYLRPNWISLIYRYEKKEKKLTLWNKQSLGEMQEKQREAAAKKAYEQ
jgi:hypothetical protein